jgi:23S rRNA (guanosine2251-2'-O)-methyltransferase
MNKNKNMQTKQQKQEEESLLFGLRSVMEAIHAGKQIDKLYIQSGLQGAIYNELMLLLKNKNIAYQYVPAEKLNRLTTKNHQGVVGYIAAIAYQKIENVLPTILKAKKNPLILILDRITDVRNFGAIARTAECAGVNAIIIPSVGSAQINADAIKTSAGALHKVTVCKEENLKNVIDYLKKKKLKIVACTEKASEYYYQTDFTEPTAIIMGSEENGISNDYLMMADAKVKIPMKGKIASLNVSVAAGIILYETVSQRMIDI